MINQFIGWVNARKHEKFLQDRQALYVQKDSRGIVQDEASGFAAQPHDPQLLWRIYLSVSWVRACVDIITKAVLAEGWELVGNKKNFPKVRQLLINPNPQDDGTEILQNVCEDLLLFGNSYLEKVKTANGDLAELYTLDGTITRTRVDGHGLILGYEQDSGAGVRFEPEDVGLFRLSTKGGSVLGTSPLNSLILTVEADLHAQKYNLAFLKNGARPRGIFGSKSATKEQIRRNREYMKTEAGGSQNAGKDLFLEGDVEYKELQKTPQDIQFLDLRRLNREEILSVYGVPPSKIGIIESGNIGGGSGDSQDTTFKQEVVKPMQRRIASRYTTTVIRDGQGVPDVELKFVSTDPDGDEKRAEVRERQAKSHEIYLSTGVMTIAEVRAELGLKNIEAVPQPTKEAQLEKQVGDIPDSAIPIKKRNPSDWLDNNENTVRTEAALLGELKRQEKVSLAKVNEALTAGTPDAIVDAIDAEALNAVLSHEVGKTYEAGYAGARIELKKQVAVGGEFGVRPGDFDGIEAHITTLITDFTAELKTAMNATVAQGIKAGEGAVDITSRVSSVWNMPRTFQTVNGSRTLSNEVWAKMTSRTETLGALNKSRVTSFGRQGITQYDVLLATGAEVDCRQIASESPYEESVAYSLLPVHPNCRCTVVPHTGEEQ